MNKSSVANQWKTLFAAVSISVIGLTTGCADTEPDQVPHRIITQLNPDLEVLVIDESETTLYGPIVRPTHDGNSDRMALPPMPPVARGHVAGLQGAATPGLGRLAHGYVADQSSDMHIRADQVPAHDASPQPQPCDCNEDSCRSDWVETNIGCDVCVVFRCDSGRRFSHSCNTCQ